jgi:hypothetical protein
VELDAMEYLWVLYSVRVTIERAGGKLIPIGRILMSPREGGVNRRVLKITT